MVGYKIYKENEDGSIHMMRIMKVKRSGKVDDIKVYDYSDDEYKVVDVSTLSDYTPLEPDGVLMASIVKIKNDGKTYRDVIISAAKFLNIKYKLSVMPYAVCRQSINDIFYEAMTGEESDLVGLAVNQDDCPQGFDFGLMFAADEVEFNEFVNFYRLDTLEDIYDLIRVSKYDAVLAELYEDHVKHVNKPEFLFKKECDGWCKDLKTLLTLNNFQSDINQMLGISEFDINLLDNCIEKEIPDNKDVKYMVANDDLRMWLSYTYKLNMKEVNILEFDHDINLADFNNASYLLIRDNTKKLYLAVYIVEGEYLESDLIAKDKENDFMSKFKFMFSDKKYANK
jgi:hypothetical protein